MKTKLRFNEVEVRGVKIQFIEKYKVDEKGEEVFDRKLDDNNLLTAYDAYRIKKDMVTMDMLHDITFFYGLSLTVLAKCIGIPEKTMERYMNGMIQTEEHDFYMKSFIKKLLSEDEITVSTMELYKAVEKRDMISGKR